ncbi:MAG: DUF2523 family protein [Methylovulum sp.]
MIDVIIEFFNSVIAFFGDIGQFFESLADYLDQFILWFTNGIYEFFSQWFAAFVLWSTLTMIKFQLFMVGFAWDIAQQILVELNISAALSSAWSMLDSNILDALTFFNVPDAINVLMSARVTRYVLTFLHL